MPELKRKSKEIEFESPYGNPLRIKNADKHISITISGMEFRTPEEGKDLIIEAIEDVCK